MRSKPESTAEKMRYRANPDSPVSPMIPASDPESTDPNERLKRQKSRVNTAV